MEVVLFMEKMMKDMVPICYKNVKKELYLIDEYGNIYSNYKKDFLIPREDKDGYLQIKLSSGSRKNPCYVRIATLVAWHFLGPPLNLKDPTINHIDSNIKNNYYKNLEWIERSKNSSIRKNKGQGSLNHEAKLNEQDVIEISNLLLYTNLSLNDIAKKYQVSKSTVYNIQAKKTWKHITKDYDFSCRKIIRNKEGRFKLININLID